MNSFAHGQAELVKLKVPAGHILAGLTLAEFAHNLPSHNTKLLICAVERDGQVSIPNGFFRIQPGDIVSFVLPRRDRRAFLKLLAIKHATVKDCMIVGGGRSAYYLSRQLIHMGIGVKIIERDAKRCEELSVLLPEAVIINGDGTDEGLLKEEGIESVDSFVSLTGIDEQNILLTLHARKISDTKVITKVNRSNFHDVINDLDLGSIIYPRFITSEAINIPLKDLKLKDSLMIAFINRGTKISLPSGDDTIQVGDTVMVVTTHTGFKDLDDILA